MHIFRYRGNGCRPESVEKLMLRRRAILRRMKAKTDSNNPLDPVELKRINDAYEYLKADLEDTFESFRQIKENVNTDTSGVALNCSAECVLAVGISSHGNERWKSAMEDTRVFQDCFGNDPHKCFFGIYDGHHGTFAAEMAATELHHALLMEMVKFDPRTKCTCSFNAADNKLNTAYCEIHSRAESKLSETGVIHEESTAMIQKIIQESEEKLQEWQSRNSFSGRKERKKKSKDPFREKLDEAFRKANFYTDVLLSWGKDEHSRVRWSGASTLACIIRDFPQSTPVQDEHEEEQVYGESKESGAPKDANKDAGDNGEENTTNEIENEDEEEEFVTAEPLRELGEIHIANAGN